MPLIALLIGGERKSEGKRERALESILVVSCRRKSEGPHLEGTGFGGEGKGGESFREKGGKISIDTREDRGQRRERAGERETKKTSRIWI